MRISTFLAVTAAASLLASPVLAQGSASKLSLASAKSGVRAGAPVTGASNLQDDDGTDSSGIIIAVAAVAAAGVGLYLALDNDDEDDLPSSP